MRTESTGTGREEKKKRSYGREKEREKRQVRSPSLNQPKEIKRATILFEKEENIWVGGENRGNPLAQE